MVPTLTPGPGIQYLTLNMVISIKEMICALACATQVFSRVPVADRPSSPKKTVVHGALPGCHVSVYMCVLCECVCECVCDCDCAGVCLCVLICVCVSVCLRANVCGCADVCANV